MKIKKRTYFLGIFLFIFLILSFFILAVSSPNPGHTGDEIFVSINGYSMTLQEALDNDFLKDSASPPLKDYTTSVSGGYHNGDSIYVNLDGQHAIQEAIDGGISFCREQNLFSKWALFFGHSSSSINVTLDGSETTFQDAIDSFKFCSYSWNYGGWGSCSSACGPGTQTRTATCMRSDGENVGNAFCAGISKTTSQSCSPWTYSWVTGSFGSCSSACGSGRQSRSVSCIRCDGARASDSSCSGSKPGTSRSCDAGDSTCGWGLPVHVSPLSCGGVTCGKGKYLRKVYCRYSGHCECIGSLVECVKNNFYSTYSGNTCYVGINCGSWSATVYCDNPENWVYKACLTGSGCMINGKYYPYQGKRHYYSCVDDSGE